MEAARLPSWQHRFGRVRERGQLAVGGGARVGRADVREHLGFARGLINRLADVFFLMSDLQRAARPLVQQLHELLVDFVDTASELADPVH